MPKLEFVELEPAVIQQIDQARILRQTSTSRLTKAQSLIPQEQDFSKLSIREIRQSLVSERLKQTSSRKLTRAMEIETELKPYYPQIIEYLRWAALRAKRDSISIKRALDKGLAGQISREQVEKFAKQVNQIEGQYNHYISLNQALSPKDTKEEALKFYRILYNARGKIIQIGHFQTALLSDSEAKFMEILGNNDNLGDGFTNEALRSMLQANRISKRPLTLANSIKRKLPEGTDIFQIQQSPEGTRWLLLKKVPADANNEKLKQPPFAFIKHEAPFETRDYSHIVERAEVGQRLEEIADPQIRTTITEFLKTKRASYLLTAAANFKPEIDKGRTTFLSVLVSSFFEEIAYRYLKLVYENKPGIVFLSPMETQTIYENLFPDHKPLDSTNYYLTYGLDGISVPDGLLIEEGEDFLILRDVVDYKNQRDGRKNSKIISEQLANFTEELIAKDFKLNDPEFAEFLGYLIHYLHPEINPKPLIIKLGEKPTIVIPQNSTFRTIHATKYILPLKTSELHNLVATLYELVRRPEPEKADLPLLPAPATTEVDLKRVEDRINAEITLAFSNFFGNQPITSRSLQEISFTPNPSARMELKNKIPKIDEYIKQIWELVRGKKLPKYMSLEQVKKAFPELQSGMVWTTLSNNNLEFRDSEEFNTYKIVSLLFVNQYGAALSKEAIRELPLKVKGMLT